MPKNLNYKSYKDQRAEQGYAWDDGLNWIESLWNKWSGGGLTQQQMEENQFSWRSMIQQQNWNQQMVEQYETPAAQKRLYEEAGFNPYALAENGVNVNAPSASGGLSSASANSGPDLSSIISTIAQLALQKGNLENQQRQTDIAAYNAETQRISATAGARKDNADAEGREIQNYIDENTKDMQISLRGLNVEQAKANIDNIRQNTEESKERIKQIRATVNELNAQISLMASEEALNYKRIEYTDKQIEDLTQLIDVHRLNKEQLEAFKPYWAQMAAAELALTKANTDEAKAIAASTYKDAALKTYELMVQEGIVEGFEKYQTENGFIDWNKMKHENPRAFAALYDIYKDADIKSAFEKETTARANSARSTRWGQNVSFVLESLSSVLGTVFQGMQAYGIYKGGKGVASRGKESKEPTPGTGSPSPINLDSYGGYRPNYNSSTSQYGYN